METNWIDKIEVAQRQIVGAVGLFFEERDPIVIHAVVASAHQILVDLGKLKDVTSSVKGPSIAASKDQGSQLNYPYNFFKHADRDPESKINVGPLGDFTREFIMDAILMLQRLTGDIPFEAKVFWTWFVSKNPQDFENCGEEIKRMQEQKIGDWDFPTICHFLQFRNIAKSAIVGNKV
ncbi:MAG TPA: hypothetical protein VGK01_03995 [Candidatus Angelobacter sp.]|jgi:hypothetical protein